MTKSTQHATTMQTCPPSSVAQGVPDLAHSLFSFIRLLERLTTPYPDIVVYLCEQKAWRAPS